MAESMSHSLVQATKAPEQEICGGVHIFLPFLHQLSEGSLSAREPVGGTYESQIACRILMGFEQPLDRHWCGELFRLDHCHDKQVSELIIEEAVAEGLQPSWGEDVNDGRGRQGPVHEGFAQ